MFKLVRRSLSTAFRLSPSRLEVVSITHYHARTEICLDHFGEASESLTLRYESNKETVDVAIHETFKLNLVYKCHLRENLKRWELEKVRFINKYLKKESERSEVINCDGAEYALSIAPRISEMDQIISPVLTTADGGATHSSGIDGVEIEMEEKRSMDDVEKRGLLAGGSDWNIQSIERESEGTSTLL